jgi:uncharacterized protein YndB with AHSA1/START domain
MTDVIPPEVSERDVYITRSFNAPRDVVWKFWTEPGHLAEWFGPADVHTPESNIEVEIKVGGRWNLGMVGDVTCELYPLSSRITKVIEGEYLEMIIESASSGQIENVFLRVQFHDHGETTRMTLHQGPFTPEFRDLTTDGWVQSFAKLDAIFEGAKS